MFFVAFSWCAIPARADPIRVTSGAVDGAFGPLGQADAGELGLMGAGLHVQDSLEDVDADVRLITPPTVAPGALVDFSGVFRLRSAIGGTVNNVGGLVVPPFTIPLHASPTRLACSGAGSFIQCTGAAPFTFETDITIAPFGGGVPVTQHLIGGGTVEGTVFRNGAGAVRYTFETSPTPEPASLLLLSTGLVGLVASRRRSSAPGEA
jgi:hypothetical protein